jgi:hypothetical protein
MKFEEALEAMRKGKKVKRARWSNSSTMWIEKGSGEMYTDDKPCDCSLSFEEITADDWVVVFDTPLDYVKAMEEIKAKTLERIGKETEKKAKENVSFLADEETSNRLEITFKSGETIAYNSGEWDDYAYDGKAVIVKRNGAWIGIYNFADVFCVELK